MEIILRAQITNAADLAAQILAWNEHSYIGDRDGNAFTEVLLVEETLSDGSKVRDFRLV